MAQTDVDRLQVAWLRLQRAVNKTVPDVSSRLWRVRNQLTPRGGPGPQPN